MTLIQPKNRVSARWFLWSSSDKNNTNTSVCTKVQWNSSFRRSGTKNLIIRFDLFLELYLSSLTFFVFFSSVKQLKCSQGNNRESNKNFTRATETKRNIKKFLQSRDGKTSAPVIPAKKSQRCRKCALWLEAWYYMLMILHCLSNTLLSLTPAESPTWQPIRTGVAEVIHRGENPGEEGLNSARFTLWRNDQDRWGTNGSEMR